MGYYICSVAVGWLELRLLYEIFILFLQATCVIRVMATPVQGIPSYLIFPQLF